MNQPKFSQASAIGHGKVMPPVPRVPAPAHRIRDDAEALAVAHELAARFAPGVSERDRERRLPFAELDEYSQSGLWGILVPKAYGGAGVSYATLAEVTAIMATADSSIAQIPQNHFYMVEALRLDGREEQKQFFFERVLEGDRLGNAFTEVGTKTILDLQTRLSGDGPRFLLNGRKYYSTGAIFSHWVPTVAFDDNGRIVVAFVKRDAAGLTLIDDWTCMGQRTTASGSAIFESVAIEPDEVLDNQASVQRPTAG